MCSSTTTRLCTSKDIVRVVHEFWVVGIRGVLAQEVRARRLRIWLSTALINELRQGSIRSISTWNDIRQDASPVEDQACSEVVITLLVCFMASKTVSIVCIPNG